MDRLAELAEEMFDEAVRRVEMTLGEGVTFRARLKSLRAALALCVAALEAASGRHGTAAAERAVEDG